MQKPLLLFLIICLLISCAGNRPKTVSQAGEVRIMEVPYKNLFKATRDYLQGRGFPVVKTNITTGEIETDYKPGAGWTEKEQDRMRFSRSSKKRAELQKEILKFRNREKRARIRAKVVKIDETNSKLEFEIICEVRDPETSWQPIPGETRGARLMYDRFFKGILVKAKR